MRTQLAVAEVRTEREEELTLLSAVLDGDMAARKYFFVRYSAVIEARVRQILRRSHVWLSEEDIKDTVSEIWLSLFEDDMRCLRRFDPARQIKVSTWVGLLARNKTIDKLRTSHLGRTVSMDNDDQGFEPASPTPLPPEELERQERRELARQAMEQLSGEERRFMEAWYVDDREPEDLASEFKIAIGTVYSRRFKIQEKLTRAVSRLTRRRRRLITPRVIH
jgi:RNA polymerase sigma-70 factor (ECF subfamily)